MNDQDNNQTNTQAPNDWSDTTQNSAAINQPIEPAIVSSPNVESATPNEREVPAAPSTPAEITPLIPLARDYEPVVSEMPPSKPEDITSDMVAEFLAQQTNASESAANTSSAPELSAPDAEPVVEDIVGTPESADLSNPVVVPGTSPLLAEDTQPNDIWDTKTELVVAEPIIPTTNDLTPNDDAPTTKSGGSWIPVIVLGLLVLVTGIIVLILLASSQLPAGNMPVGSNSSLSSTTSSEPIIQPVVPSGWVEFTDGLLGVKFALPAQASYIEIQVPPRTADYTAAEITAFRNKPAEWYYTPAGNMKFAGSDLDALYLTLNLAPGRSSGIGVLCQDSSLCQITAAVNVYRVEFAGSIAEFMSQVSISSSLSSSSTTSLTSSPSSSSNSSAIADTTSSASSETITSSTVSNPVQTSHLFGMEAQLETIHGEEYLIVKKEDYIYLVSTFADTANQQVLIDQIVGALSLSN